MALTPSKPVSEQSIASSWHIVVLQSHQQQHGRVFSCFQVRKDEVQRVEKPSPCQPELLEGRRGTILFSRLDGNTRNSFRASENCRHAWEARFLVLIFTLVQWRYVRMFRISFTELRYACMFLILSHFPQVVYCIDTIHVVMHSLHQLLDFEMITLIHLYRLFIQFICSQNSI